MKKRTVAALAIAAALLLLLVAYVVWRQTAAYIEFQINTHNCWSNLEPPS